MQFDRRSYPQVYYDYFDYQVYRGSSSGATVTVPAPLYKTPVLYRGGSIVPTRQRARRASSLMKKDPFTLTIALDKLGTSARGELYLDDGETYAFEKGELVWREFTVSRDTSKNARLVIRSEDLATRFEGRFIADGVQIETYNPKNAFVHDIASVYVERIIVFGLEKGPKSITIAGGKDLAWTFTKGTGAKGKKNGAASVLTIKAPGVHIVEDWQIKIES